MRAGGDARGTRRGHRGTAEASALLEGTAAPETAADSSGVDELDLRLQEWVQDGLLTAEQAERISEHEAGRRPRAPVGESLVAEALSYVGAALVLVAAGALSLRFWDELGPGARAALVGAAGAALLLAGSLAARTREAPGRRVRSGLWVLSTAAFAGMLVVLGADAWALPDEDVALLVTLGTLPYAAALWAAGRALPQQAVAFVVLLSSVAVAAARVAGDETAVIGAALWLTSAAWGVLAARTSWVSTRAGSVLAAFGALYAAMSLAASGRWGHVAAVATAVLVLALAVRLRDLVVLAIGTVGVLGLLPGAVHAFWPNAVAPPLALLAAGLVVMTAGIRGWRRPRR